MEPQKGWELLVASAAITLTVWWLGYTCRREKAEARRDHALYEKSVLTEIDVMRGRYSKNTAVNSCGSSATKRS
jgi:hypothetical protein